MREKAQELNESNNLREAMLDENAVLKQERFEIDLHLKSRERNLLEATREIAELERLLQTSNSSITKSLSSLSTELWAFFYSVNKYLIYISFVFFNV